MDHALPWIRRPVLDCLKAVPDFLRIAPNLRFPASNRRRTAEVKFFLIFSNFIANVMQDSVLRAVAMIVAVRVERVTLDTSSNRFVVILKDDTYHRWLPIVVGPAEAQAIALQLENVVPPRPMTHDLLKNVLDTMKASVLKVIVSDLKENTYYAVIDIKDNGAQTHIDARPSDAIALALRSAAPIFVDEEVMKKASISDDLLVKDEKTEEDEIKKLNLQLQQAVKDERYEDAAHIRDKIAEMSTKKRKNPRKPADSG